MPEYWTTHTEAAWAALTESPQWVEFEEAFAESACCSEWVECHTDFVAATLTACDDTTTCEITNFRVGPISSREIANSGYNRNDVRGYIINSEICDGYTSVLNGSVTFAGQVWQIMGGREMKFGGDTTCVWRVDLRNVASCFGLLDNIRVFENSCVDDSCDMTEAELTAITGMFRLDSGTHIVRDDSRKIDESWSMFLEAKPPYVLTPNHEFLNPEDNRRYRVVSFRANSNLEPFQATMELVPEAC